jgi:hypothetical protein
LRPELDSGRSQSPDGEVMRNILFGMCPKAL